MRYIFVVFALLFGAAQARTPNVEIAANIAPRISEIDRLPREEKRDISCASLAAYRETRSEPFRAQALIAAIVYTRSELKNKNACDVIAEPHQFPWAAGSVRKILPSKKEKRAWDSAQKAALIAYKNHPHVEYTVSRRVFKQYPGIKVFAKTNGVVFYNRKERRRHENKTSARKSTHKGHKAHRKYA